MGTHRVLSEEGGHWANTSLGRAAGGGRGPERLWQGRRKAGGTLRAPSPLTPADDAGSSFRRVCPFTPGRGLWVTVAIGGWASEGAAEGGGSLAEELEEAVLTVRLVVLLLKGALVELLEAEGTDKVLRVELLGHGGDAAARDGLLAAGAE